MFQLSFAVILFTCIRLSIAIDCATIASPPNGFVYVSSVRPGSLALYRCKSTHRLIGNHVNVCGKLGLWFKIIPVCLPVCEEPKPQPNRQQYVSMEEQMRQHKLVTSTYFKCNDGFVLIGEEIIRCDSGIWSHAEPQCVRLCSNLRNPKNGFVDVTIGKRNTRDYTASYSCRQGYILRGARIRRCLNGSWSEKIPLCEFDISTVNYVKCSEPIAPTGGLKHGTPPYMVGSSVTFSCIDKSDLLMGSRRIVCDSKGKWSGDTPSCLKVTDKSITCETTADEILQINSTTPIRVECPCNCSSSSSAPVYGLIVYKSSSSVCRAAIHSDSMKNDTFEGNSAIFRNYGAMAVFISVDVNGVDSKRSRERSLSFRFADSRAEANVVGSLKFLLKKFFNMNKR